VTGGISNAAPTGTEDETRCLGAWSGGQPRRCKPGGFHCGGVVGGCRIRITEWRIGVLWLVALMVRITERRLCHRIRMRTPSVVGLRRARATSGSGYGDDRTGLVVIAVTAVDALRVGKGVWNARTSATKQRRNDTAVGGGANAARCRTCSNILYHLRSIELVPTTATTITKEKQSCDGNDHYECGDSNGYSDLDG
jgi:hypothetical protein